jgi:hypothetical protein
MHKNYAVVDIEHCMSLATTFALGVMVGIIGSAKMRYFHSLANEIHKHHSHSCHSGLHHHMR